MSLILDTNLLLLYLVGNYDKKYITKFKKTAEFTEEDFRILTNLIKEFGNKVIITPQILAEISNHSKKIKEPKFSEYMNCLIKTLKKFEEKYIKMTDLLNSPRNLIKLGFTDVSILEAGKKYDCLILTKDFELSQYAQFKGCRAFNYNQFYEIKSGT